MQYSKSVQALRGFAALSVIFFHVYNTMQTAEYGGNIVFKDVARYGHLGVNFFFVLSGLIILMAHQGDIGNFRAAPQYLYRRVIRIYPAYWIYLTGFIVAAALGLGYPDFSWSGANMASSYTLVAFTDPVTPPIKVAWTLFFELRFYLMFTLLLFSARLGILAFSVWMLVVLISFFVDLGISSDFFSPWNLYFGVGMVGLLLVQRLPSKTGLWIAIVGLLGFLIYVAASDAVGAVNQGDLKFSHLLLGASFGAIIVGAMLVERHYALRLPVWMTFLGDASYSIYLVHSAAVSLMLQIGAKLGLINIFGPKVYFVLLFFAAASAGCVAYVIIERPLTLLLRSRKRRIEPVPVSA